MITFSLSGDVVSLHAITVERRVLGIPIHFVDQDMPGAEGQLKEFHFHKVWSDIDYRADVYCRWLVCALVLRAYAKLKGFFWRVMRALYWVGLVDLQPGGPFRWSQFYRIKSR